MASVLGSLGSLNVTFKATNYGLFIKQLENIRKKLAALSITAVKQGTASTVAVKKASSAYGQWAINIEKTRELLRSKQKPSEDRGFDPRKEAELTASVNKRVKQYRKLAAVYNSNAIKHEKMQRKMIKNGGTLAREERVLYNKHWTNMRNGLLALHKSKLISEKSFKHARHNLLRVNNQAEAAIVRAHNKQELISQQNHIRKKLVVARVARAKELSANKSFLASMAKMASAYYAATTAIRMFVRALTAVINTQREVETGFLRVERMLDNVDSRQFRADTMKTALDSPSIQIGELQKVQEIVGRMGFKEAESITDFSATIVKLGSVVSGSNVQDLANDMGKLLSVFNISTKDQVKEVKNLADVLLSLQKSFMVNIPEITNISKRLAGVGRGVGMSVIEINSLSAAMKHMGVNTEVGAGAFVRFAEGILGNTREIGMELGKSGTALDNFVKGFEENAYKAFQNFLRDMPETFSETSEVLQKMGVTGVRYMPAIKIMRENWHVLGETLDVAKKSLEDVNSELEDQVRYTEDGADGTGSYDGAIKELKDSWIAFKLAILDSKPLILLINTLTTGMDLMVSVIKKFRDIWENIKTSPLIEQMNKLKPILDTMEWIMFTHKKLGQGVANFVQEHVEARRAARVKATDAETAEAKKDSAIDDKTTDKLGLDEGTVRAIMDAYGEAMKKVAKATTAREKVSALTTASNQEIFSKHKDSPKINELMQKLHAMDIPKLLDKLDKQRSEAKDAVSKESFEKFFTGLAFDEKRRISDERIDALGAVGSGGTFSGKGFAQNLIQREIDRIEEKKVTLLEKLSRTADQTFALQEKIERENPSQAIIDWALKNLTSVQ